MFFKVFQLLAMFETQLDILTEKKTFQKPSFFKLLPLIESFFILVKIFYDEDGLNYLRKDYKESDHKT